MIVRRTTEKDLDDMSRLMKGYFDFYRKEYPEEEKLRNLIKTLVKGKVGVQFIAIDDNAIGFATIYHSYSTLSAGPMCVMNDLFVDINARGKGVGEKIFRTCQQYTIDNGYNHMEWMTEPDNPAQRLYDKWGGTKSNWVFYWI